ncbi:MAG TPA: glycosyltransferase [Sedimentisphaerales bacterium]|nr:glycosyltransferase [Sedimentisphaerales bacterium]
MMTLGVPLKVMRVVVMWPRFGPYHLARLNAADMQFQEHDAKLLALETARSEATYQWDVVDEPVAVERHILFPESDYCDLQSREIRAMVFEYFARIKPRAVAVCGWDFPESVAALRWCRRNGVPCILMSASTHRDAKRYFWKEWLKGRLVRCFSAALVAGRPQKDYVTKLGMSPERVFTGYDAVDNEYFSCQAEAVRANEQEYRARYGLPLRYFLSSNRFIPVKNLFRLLAAYAKYREGITDPWDLVLLGDGELMPQMRQSIQDMHLQECVVLPGFKQYDELPAYYGLASCLVLASTSETWGLVVNEAMASGLPVLVSKACGCCDDLVREGQNGFSFDPLDIDEMAEKMRVISHGGCDLGKMGQVSRDIIAPWGCDNFGRNLWKAAQCAVEHPVRNRDPIASILLRVLTSVR